MAYKYLNDNGLKAYTKKVKGALKDLHTPIAISTLNTVESNAQNVRNIADFIAKAKAAGITDVNGMVVSCIIDDNYSGVGYLYGDNYIQGVLIKDDLIDNMCFAVTSIGAYNEISIITPYSSGEVTSGMLDQGARKPIILTPRTTEVDEETYQKLLSDDVDVIFKSGDDEYCQLTYKCNNNAEWEFDFNCVSFEAETVDDIYVYAYIVKIDKNTPHTCRITTVQEATSPVSLLNTMGFLHESILKPVLQEIDLTGTDAERKAKLTQFETDWKALTGASTLRGARFIGHIDFNQSDYMCLLSFNSARDFYSGIAVHSDNSYEYLAISVSTEGYLEIIPIFSHLESVEILTDNTAESNKKNLDNLNAYKSNLELLGVDTSIGFQVPIRVGMAGGILFRGGSSIYSGYFSNNYIRVTGSGKVLYQGVQLTESTELVTSHKAIVPAINEGFTLAQALKDLHTPIAISTLNTVESNAQNVRNIADFVAKAKAAGIADVDGMAVTCLLSSGYSGVGYLHFVDGNYTLQGVEIQEELERSTCFLVWDDGSYKNTNLITGDVTSQDLTRGARKPIILTPSTTEVDEETYQKLLSDDVDVMFTNGNDCALTIKYEEGTAYVFCFTGLSAEGTTLRETYLYGYKVSINETAPHEVNIKQLFGEDIFTIISGNGFIRKDDLSLVLQEIDLTGTDAERKDKLAQFEADWKALTGANNLTGARFVGRINSSESNAATVLLQYNSINVEYEGISISDDIYPKIQTVRADPVQGYLTITPLFYHLEPVEIFSDNSAASKQKNLDNLNAYKTNLEQLGVDTSNGFQVPFQKDGGEEIGVLYYSAAMGQKEYVGISFSIRNTSRAQEVYINSTGTYTLHLLAFDSKVDLIGQFARAVNAFGAIELKASDNAANKAALTAYKKILTDADISITNGYSVPVRITGNAQEYHGMLNIGTGALLSGIVTDVNETHYYPFNVNTTDGAITFDANNYFLEKTSNEVTEMLDAIKYSYTPVPLTVTASTNKTQLDLFLSKVPNAQVMHITYKGVYAGTLHKIGTDWFGQLVKNTNNYEDCICIKLAADGTVTEGTTSLAQVNAKLANIIG